MSGDAHVPFGSGSAMGGDTASPWDTGAEPPTWVAPPAPAAPSVGATAAPPVHGQSTPGLTAPPVSTAGASSLATLERTPTLPAAIPQTGAHPQPKTPAPNKGSGDGLSNNARIGITAIIVILVISIGAFAVVVGRGVASLTVIDALEQGECVESHFPTEGNAEEGEFFSVLFVSRVDCAEPHAYEVYSVNQSQWGPDDVYPGVDDAFSVGDRICREQFDLFTNSSYATSPYDFFTFVPSTDSWASGDRKILCLIGRSDGSSLTTGTLEASGERTIS